MLDTVRGEWPQPEVNGDRPPGRAYHTLTPASDDKLVLYGGCDEACSFGDVWVLDTSTWEWSRPVTTGVLPAGRSCHSACFSAEREQLVVYGGQDGGGEKLADISVLDTGTLEVSLQ